MKRWIWMLGMGIVMIGVSSVQEKKGSEDKPQSSHDQPDSRSKKAHHSAKCPAGCKTCTDAIKKALDYLASQQKEEGYLSGKAVISYGAMDKHTGNMMTTAVAGLAFLANGSTASKGEYKQQVTKIRDYMDKTFPDIIKYKQIGSGGGPVYSAALSLLFLTNLYEKEKDETAKHLIPKLIQYITDRVGDKVTTCLWYGKVSGDKTREGIDKKVDGTKVWVVSGATALLNSCIISLGRAKAAGFEVPEKPFEVAKDYYAKYAVTEGKYAGTMKYDQHNHFIREPRRGRTIASLLAMMNLGIFNDKKFKPLLEFARKNYDRTGTHHTPSIHTTLSAFTFYALGEEDWKKFVEANFEKLLANQKEDGSLARLWTVDELKYMQPKPEDSSQTVTINDTKFGPNYATAHFALILQVATQHVKLYLPPKEKNTDKKAEGASRD